MKVQVKCFAPSFFPGFAWRAKNWTNNRVSKNKRFKNNMDWGEVVGKMIVYKVLYKNYEFKKGDLMGTLIERRKDLRGKSRVESGLRWAKLTFGQMVKDKHAIFVVPHELRFGGEAKCLVEKGIFAK